MSSNPRSNPRPRRGPFLVPALSLALLLLAAPARAQGWSWSPLAPGRLAGASGDGRTVVASAYDESLGTTALTAYGPSGSRNLGEGYAARVADDGSIVTRSSAPAYYDAAGNASPFEHLGERAIVTGVDAATGAFGGYDLQGRAFRRNADGTFLEYGPTGDGQTVFEPVGTGDYGAYGAFYDLVYGGLSLRAWDGSAYLDLDAPGATLVDLPSLSSPGAPDFLAAFRAADGSRFLRRERLVGGAWVSGDLAGVEWASNVRSGTALLRDVSGAWFLWRDGLGLSGVEAPEGYAIVGGAVTDAGLVATLSDGLDDSVWTARPVPEPAALATLGLGALSLLRRRRSP